MRDLGTHGEEAMPVQINAMGAVTVADEAIGQIKGFQFIVDAGANLADKKRLLAAAERRLSGEWAQRTAALCADRDENFALETTVGATVSIAWRDLEVAHLTAGKSLLKPELQLDATLNRLSPDQRNRIVARLSRWFDSRLISALGPLLRIDAGLHDPATPPPVRALLAPLVQAGGIIARKPSLGILDGLDKASRHQAARLGITFGALDIFCPKLLKPEAIRWRLALSAIAQDQPMPPLPPAGVALIEQPQGADLAALRSAGFRGFAGQMVRIDLIERLSRAAHDQRDGKKLFAPNQELATSIGLREAAQHQLMEALGFRLVAAEKDEAGQQQWAWRGRRSAPGKPSRPAPGNAFAKLSELKLGND
jgi:ATP-dependent RNA helicase SUPV3L1/SUV3